MVAVVDETNRGVVPIRTFLPGLQTEIAVASRADDIPRFDATGAAKQIGRSDDLVATAQRAGDDQRGGFRRPVDLGDHFVGRAGDAAGLIGSQLHGDSLFLHSYRQRPVRTLVGQQDGNLVALGPCVLGLDAELRPIRKIELVGCFVEPAGERGGTYDLHSLVPAVEHLGLDQTAGAMQTVDSIDNILRCAGDDAGTVLEQMYGDFVAGRCHLQ